VHPWGDRTLGRELQEVEVVVEHLTRIIKNGSFGLGYDLREVKRSHGRAENSLVEVVNIGQKVLAVVKFHRFARNVRFECIRSIRKCEVFETARFISYTATRKGKQKGENKCCHTI
jgi:hypothetical protein